MRRRDFITWLGGAARAATLLSARRAGAQQPSMPVIGFLDSGSQAPNAHLVAAFRQGLSENGYVESQNLTVEYRWAEGNYDRLAGLASDLVTRQVALIVAVGGEPSARAARFATTTIPIIFDTSSNPVELGWVKSLNQPGGNMTGVNQMVEELVPKELGLLHELVPQAKDIAVLVNAKYPRTEAVMRNAQTAARSLGTALQIVTADTDQDLEAVFKAFTQQAVGALFVAPGPFFFNRRARIIALAAQQKLPALYVRREFADDGGLMSYGTSLVDTYHQVGLYAGRVLKGEKPGDLPIVQPTKFELVINLKTAKALGLTVPSTFLASADEVIE